MPTTTPPPLLQLVKFVVSRQRSINKVFFIGELALLAVWLMAFAGVLFQSPSPLLSSIIQIGPLLGTLALILFCLTLIPGIITRLRIAPQYLMPVSTMITPIRRHLGILMFLLAFVHMSFTTTLPYIALTLDAVRWLQPPSLADRLSVVSSAFPPPVVLFEQVAMVGWLLLLPVWLTSNDFSQKKLGRQWKKLQRLTYVALWFIFAHVALQGELLAAVLGFVGLLELLSWIKVRQNRQKPAAATVE